MFNLDRMEHTATRLNLLGPIPLGDLKMLLYGPWGDRNPGETTKPLGPLSPLEEGKTPNVSEPPRGRASKTSS